MNRDELRATLKQKGVNESLYCLDGPAKQSESYSIVEDGGAWKVVYKERGEFTDVAVNLTLEEACSLVYRMFKETFGWPE
jgi:hypothetical protein